MVPVPIWWEMEPLQITGHIPAKVGREWQDAHRGKGLGIKDVCDGGIVDAQAAQSGQ